MPVFWYVVRAILYFAAGVGATSVLDKFVPDKTATPPQVQKETNWLRLILIVFTGAAAMIFLKFMAKKLNIKILK